MTSHTSKKEAFRWSYRKKGTQILNICIRFLFLYGFTATLIIGSSSLALANPTGGVVAGGSATITSTSTTEQINQTSENAVINWNTFNIAAGEKTQFIQPNPSAVALNRVFNSTELSTIDGNLAANGHVIIINPNGVIIGPGGNIDTAGFIATSANIADSSFMKSTGALDFNIAGKANAAIVNQGTITVEGEGLIALVAPTVRNDGVIQGNLARLQLGAADTFGVDLYGDGLLSLAVGTDTDKRTITVKNSGSIIAQGGKVLMTAAAASNVVDSVINNTGVIQAQSLVNKNGEIALTGAGADVTASGKIDASGVNGGDIKISGNSVTVTSDAVVNADGGTSVNGVGNGGTIVTWANNENDSEGTFSARGGAKGGNGGSIEVSTAGNVMLGGLYDAAASHGLAGTFLLDPAALEIKSGSGPTTSNVIYEDTIAGESVSGTNVTLTATGSGITMDNLADNILAGGSGAITLAATGATGSVVFANTANGISTTTGNITVTAGSGGINIGNLQTTDGAISLTTAGNGSITAGNLGINSSDGNAGSVTANSDGALTVGTVSVANSAITGITGDSISLTSGNGGSITAEDLSINSTSGGNSPATGSILTVNSSGALTVNGDVLIVNIDGGDPVLYSTATAALSALNNVNVTGPITVSSFDHDMPYIGSTASLSINSTNGGVNIGSAVNVSSDELMTNGGANNQTATTTLTIAANNDIVISGPVDGASSSAVSGNPGITESTSSTVSIISANGNLSLSGAAPEAQADTAIAQAAFTGAPFSQTTSTDSDANTATLTLSGHLPTPQIPQTTNSPVPFQEIGPLDRPILSVANKVIDYDPPFEPINVLTLNADVSIKLATASASNLANIEPAAGGPSNAAQTDQGLANIEPAAGTSTATLGETNNEITCANNFLDNKTCIAQ
jgi:filamentous hemagglutinin family protein